MIKKDFLQSKAFKRVIYTFGVIILTLVIFRAGIFVGYRKAAFSYGLGDNYYKIFDDPRGRPGGPGFVRDGFPNAHGVVGKIIQVSYPKLVIEGIDGTEKVVLLEDGTIIKQSRDVVDAKILSVDNFVAVIGSPTNDGYIKAKLVRIVPPPPMPFE